MPPAWPEQRGALFTRHWVGVGPIPKPNVMRRGPTPNPSPEGEGS
jgi:hypothetical protein